MKTKVDHRFVVRKYSKMRLLNKKGQGLSMNVIVVAAIALIVLLVLVFIFSTKLSIFGTAVGSCKGTCISKDAYSNYEQCENHEKGMNGPKYIYDSSGTCIPEEYICCIKP